MAKSIEREYVKIENYLHRNFPNKKVVLNKNLKEGQNDIETWGKDSVQILVSELETVIEYRPIWKS